MPGASPAELRDFLEQLLRDLRCLDQPDPMLSPTRVLATTGVSIAGAVVEAMATDGEVGVVRAVTDQSGRFELLVPDSGLLRVVVRKPGFISNERIVVLGKPTHTILEMQQRSSVILGTEG